MKTYILYNEWKSFYRNWIHPMISKGEWIKALWNNLFVDCPHLTYIIGPGLFNFIDIFFF